MTVIKVPFAPHEVDVSDEEAAALRAQGLVLDDKPAGSPPAGDKPAGSPPAGDKPKEADK